MNPEIMRQLGFGKEMDLVNAGKCPICECTVNMADFRTDLDLKEYEISGLCVFCQDRIFQPDEESNVE